MVYSEETEKEGRAMDNAIILELGAFDGDDIKDLRDGEGKIFKKISKAIARLQAEGVISPEVQPVIAVVKKKPRKLID